MRWRRIASGLGAGTALTASFFYNVQSGRPYSTTFSIDMNGDRPDNDIVFVPASASDVVVMNGTWEELNAYIEADDSMKGPPRRSFRSGIPDGDRGRIWSTSDWRSMCRFAHGTISRSRWMCRTS